MNPFIERHHDEIAGAISCFDRVVVTGTLPDIGHAQAMAGYLTYHDIRLFDFPRWAQPLRDDIRGNAERLAGEAGLKIEFIRSHKAFRKEQRIKDIVKERGEHPVWSIFFRQWRPAHRSAPGMTRRRITHP